MPDAKTTGSDAAANGSAKNRDHKQGNQNRAFTPQQKEAVIRVRKCSHTAYYEILGVEKSVSDGEIKKAYRKLSLLTHPDKNGYDGADEAFKMVSRAFQVLSDPEKKDRFDKFGGDPDSRFGAGGAAASPFSGFGRPGPGGRGPMFEDEISPEELFNRFFGGQGFGFDMFGGQGGSAYGNFGGGPGIRVYHFGGARPRRRPREANREQEEDSPGTFISLITNLLPVLILFVLPLLSSVFSGGESSRLANFHFQPTPPYDSVRTTSRFKVKYYVKEQDIVDYPTQKLKDLDEKVESSYVSTLQYHCQSEMQARNRLMQEAQGWFFQDADRIRQAKSMEMANCKRLDQLGVQRNNFGAFY